MQINLGDHSPIQIISLGVSFPDKVCFENFSTIVECGSRVAVIGRNGSGKSTLLKILMGTLEPSVGSVRVPRNVIRGYVPQVIENFGSLSGGQRFQRALTEALCQNPNLLLLDEPTNHLDGENRQSLMRMLRSYGGTLIVISHDPELLRICTSSLWHIDSERINVFTGDYDDYVEDREAKRLSIGRELTQLERRKREMQAALVREQRRAAKSRAIGKKKIERREWTPAVGHCKANDAEKVTGKMRSSMDEKRRNLREQLSAMRPREVILPKFALPSTGAQNCTILSVTGGAVSRVPGVPLLKNISFSLSSGGRMAIVGKNGSGKSTLAGAILGDENIIKSGDWRMPRRGDIGYLDQHYGTLRGENSAFDSIFELVPFWSADEIRKHLATFLFRKNGEVKCSVNRLSGGEKARLSLALIAARPPKLLILDEITNNLDLETRDYVVQVLENFAGAMVVISHDIHFLESIGIHDRYALDGCSGSWQSTLR
jgi:ATPase subunit of ABC transporter with duplicated ATPase domains